MVHAPNTQSALPEGWADAIARGEADLEAGRVSLIDADALRREIEADADHLERQIAARHASPA